MSRARILADYVSSGDELAAVATTANGALQRSGGVMTGAITTNSTFDGVDIATAVAANTAKVTNYNQTLADINALDVAELGTVTSANLANTAIVYPAGHILGIQSTTMQGTQTVGTSLIDVTDGTTALVVTSTNTNATKFFITAMTYLGGNTDVGTHFDLWSSIDGGSYSKLDAAHSNYGGGGSSGKDFMFGSAGDNDAWNNYTGCHCTGTFLWTPGSFSTSVAVKIRTWGYQGTTYIGRNTNHNNSSRWAHAVPSTLTMWEIK